MLLKTDTGEYVTVFLESTHLEVLYNSGMKLIYKNVPYNEFRKLCANRNAIKYIKDNITGRYICRRVR